MADPKPMTAKRLALRHKQIDPEHPCHDNEWWVQTGKELIAEVARLGKENQKLRLELTIKGWDEPTFKAFLKELIV